MWKVFFLAVALLCSGCATQIAVTYTSDPPGATLYHNGQQMGLTPTTLYYAPSDDQIKYGEMNITPMIARWPSGAEAGPGPRRLPVNAGPRSYNFLRPNVPGLETDLQANYQRGQLFLQLLQVQQQSQQAEQQRLYQQQQLQQQQQQLQMQQQQQLSPPRLNTNCTSYTSGGQTYTKCQ